MEKDGLRKLTVSKSIENIFKLDIITLADLKKIDKSELYTFYEEVNKCLNLLKGRERC